jgi:AraC-like DNA-binding protein
VDAERVRRDLDVSEDVLRDPSASVSLEVMTRAWAMVPELAGDPDFGLVAAETMPPGSYGALEYAVLSSATATEALERAVRFQKVTYAMSDLTFAVEGPTATIRSRSFGLASDDDLRHYIEHGFAFVATRVRNLLTPGPQPLRVAFPHRVPADTRVHRRVFGPNVQFAQPRAELVFASADLARDLASHDSAFLEAFADEEQKLSMVAMHAATSTKERVRHLLLARMRQGDASVASIARILRLSTRTLQRNLRDENAPFSELVDEVRAAEARRYVLEGKLSFGEMAFRLGFSQQSAFFRAFKRWTGATPSELRARASR